MMFEVARALSDKPVSGLVVAQSFGGLNSGESFNPSRVTSLVGEKLHARVYHLYVPAVVATKDLRAVLLADPDISAALDVARQASTIHGRYRKGRKKRNHPANRIIGLTWDDLQKLENVVAVACGSEKTAAILGALRTGLLDYLIIDDRTLSKVEKADAEQRAPISESGPTAEAL